MRIRVTDDQLDRVLDLLDECFLYQPCSFNFGRFDGILSTLFILGFDYRFDRVRGYHILSLKEDGIFF